MNTLVFFIFELVVFLFSVMVHEISHGFLAERLGDPTARDAGRLTLNPLSHIDPFGSIILPLLMAIPALFGAPGPIFGWAKPVPYNPMNLKHPKSGSGIIALAGPASNFLIAIVFGLLIRLASASSPITFAFGIITYINILLGVFNLIPIPPLDGSKVLFALLPQNNETIALARFLERYGMIMLLAFLFFGFQLIVPIIQAIFSLVAGIPLGV